MKNDMEVILPQAKDLNLSQFNFNVYSHITATDEHTNEIKEELEVGKKITGKDQTHD